MSIETSGGTISGVLIFLSSLLTLVFWPHFRHFEHLQIVS